MLDLYETRVICEGCGKVTKRDIAIRDGFEIRRWRCRDCSKIWYHPKDIEEYNRFVELKNKGYKVKLRMVGNSWIISIPKEIVKFEEANAVSHVSLTVQKRGELIVRLIKKCYKLKTNKV